MRSSGDRDAADLGVAFDSAAKVVDRRLNAEDLSERPRDELGVLPQGGPLVRVIGEESERPAERLDGRVDRRGDEGAEQFVRFRAGMSPLSTPAYMVAARLGLVRPALLPPLGEVAAELVALTQTARLWRAVLDTLLAATGGLALAALLGLPAGLLLGMHPRAERATRLLVDVGRSFPGVALLPVFLLLLGVTGQMKVALVFLAGFFPILLQALYGARRLEPTILETVRSYRLPPLLRFRRVVVPSAAPYMLTGVRIAAGASVLVAVSVGVVSQTPGLGREVTLAQTGGATASSLVFVFYAALLGLGLTALLEAAERRLLRWRYDRV